MRELGLVILVDARKGPAAPALFQALAALQVSQGDSCPQDTEHLEAPRDPGAAEGSHAWTHPHCESISG